MFEINQLSIEGCLELRPKIMEDVRGQFIKIFNTNQYLAAGLEISFEEEYYSTSKKNVIRGMHFQRPPLDHVKIVYCTAGEVFDVVLDLRANSPTYGEVNTLFLSRKKANVVYIPKGVAHGFCATSEEATLVYKVSTVYAPELDGGVAWDSIGIEWPTRSPIISDRDKSFVSFANFISPF
jgi:dTDP-4-dehydrorhamnose 3,5-epimerase